MCSYNTKIDRDTVHGRPKACIDAEVTRVMVRFRVMVKMGKRHGSACRYDCTFLLGHLLRDDLINPVKMSVRTSVRPYVRTSTIKHNAATNQIVEFVRVDETFTTI